MSRVDSWSMTSASRFQQGVLMLDLKFVVANAEAVKQNCRNRNVPADVIEDVDRVVALEAERTDVAPGGRRDPPPAKRGRPVHRPRARSRKAVGADRRRQAPEVVGGRGGRAAPPARGRGDTSGCGASPT